MSSKPKGKVKQWTPIMVEASVRADIIGLATTLGLGMGETVRTAVAHLAATNNTGPTVDSTQMAHKDRDQ